MATSTKVSVTLDSLPGRPQAELAVTEALERGETFELLLLVVNRLPLINERFGYEVGDRILEAYSERLSEELDDRCRLYRWSAAALVAFAGTGDWKRSASTCMRFDETVWLSGKPVRLSMRAASGLFSVDQFTRLDNLMQRMDYFVATELEIA